METLNPAAAVSAPSVTKQIEGVTATKESKGIIKQSTETSQGVVGSKASEPPNTVGSGKKSGGLKAHSNATGKASAYDVQPIATNSEQTGATVSSSVAASAAALAVNKQKGNNAISVKHAAKQDDTFPPVAPLKSFICRAGSQPGDNSKMASADVNANTVASRNPEETEMGRHVTQSANHVTQSAKNDIRKKSKRTRISSNESQDNLLSSSNTSAELRRDDDVKRATEASAGDVCAQDDVTEPQLAAL